jgi:hypothetical protein
VEAVIVSRLSPLSSAIRPAQGDAVFKTPTVENRLYH